MKFLIAFTAIVAVAVASPRMSIWTLQELSDALQNPNTNPTVIPILEQALDDLMAALFAGENVQSIIVPLPAGIDVLPSPVETLPVVPIPVEPETVAPTPVEVAQPNKSPLVQIIVNVLGNEQVADVINPAPVSPPIPLPLPLPEPVLVQELPTPIVVAPVPVNPVDVIAVNPVDSWGPNGLIPVVAGNEVGPI